MLLNWLEMNNWQSYRGDKNRFDFTGPESTRNSGIILGRNAQGKSAFFEAFQFLFYGRTAVVDRDSDSNPKRRKPLVHERKDMYPLMCWEAWNEGAKSFGVRGNFSIDGEEYLIERRFISNKKKPDEPELKEEFYILKSSNKKKEPNPEEFVNSLLPKSLTKFFTIDGELLTDYRKLFNNQRAGLGKDLENILRMGVLDSAIHETNSLRKSLAARQRKIELTNEKEKGRREELENLEDDIINASEKVAKCESRIKELEAQSEDLFEWLQGEGNMDAHVEKLDEIDEAEIRVKREMDDLRDRRGRQLANGWKQVLNQKLETAIQSRQETLDRQKSNKDEADMLVARLKACNNKLKGEPCYACYRPTSDLSASDKVSISDEISTLEIQIEALTKQSETPNPYPVMHQINLLNQLTTDIPFSQTDEISKLISSKEIELIRLAEDRKATLLQCDADALEKHRDEKANFQFVSAELGEQRDQLITHRNAEEIATRRRDLRAGKSKVTVSGTELPSIIKQIKIADLLVKISTESKDPFRNNTRDSVQEIANDTYLQLIQEDDHASLEFDQYFRVSVYYKDGTSVALTPGQKALATYCILEALSQVSDMSFPLIVDSPGQGVDGEYIEAIFKHFLSMSERQVIVIPTTAEIDESKMIENFGSSVASIFEISRGSSRETQIKEVHRRK